MATEQIIQVANRQDLIELKNFLSDQLPNSCYIYYHVHSLVTAPHGEHTFYLIRHQGTFKAFVGLSLDHCHGDNGLRKFWTISQWARDSADLVEIYKHIKEIDWINDSYNMYVEGHVPDPNISSFFHNFGLELDPCPVDWFVLDIQKALSLELSFPDDVYVKSLERCHAPIVYEHWPWKTWTTVDQVANEIDQQPSGGVFLKQNDQLVSWVMGYVPNGLSRLNTLEHYRRRGFAALAIKYMAKRMAQFGCPPFGDVLVGNEASRKLFESLGFCKTQPAHHFSKFP